MRLFARAALGALAFVGVCAAAASAGANPRALPFTYPYETLAKGDFELEQFADLTPSVALSTSTGKPANLGLFLFTTEFEYGLTDRLELGLYFQLAPSAGDGFASAGALGNTAIKQRLRYRIGREGELPIDMSVYGELAESDREIEIEAKLNLQKRFGGLRIMSNLWAEYELYFDGKREWVLNPTLGATYQLMPELHIGAESWVRAEFPEGLTGTRPYGLGPHAYVGPTVMANFGKLWFSLGTYFRVSDVERPVEVGDVFGRVWVRAVTGVEM
ncbi:MAG: hypothetical protein U0441_14725 [Polyangiaceae bacterium]